MELTPEMIEQLRADFNKARTDNDLMGEWSHQENNQSFT